MTHLLDPRIFGRIRRRMSRLYGSQRVDMLMARLLALVGRYGVADPERPHTPRPRWDENEVILITYADLLRQPDECPLRTLASFADRYLRGSIRTIHLLPFYPWSSDDGFSVKDYREVEDGSGSWKDVDHLAASFSLMFDVVLNHASAQGHWAIDFQKGIEPARHYFIPLDPSTDLSQVVRPRTSPLLSPIETRYGERHVWTTFSADQLDLNWSNPDVLFEFLDIIHLYISHGARVLRLDAVAFLWKEIGTGCIHLPETHEMVKLLRDFLDMVAPGTVVITETNVPHEENISYFGEGDEAHMVYNFTLPPLLLHGLLTGDASRFSQWAASLGEPPEGCTYFNFTASHDGVGVRPLQGILGGDELDAVIEAVRQRGGRVSYKSDPGGAQSPYELNITYVDALSSPDDPELGLQRFLCSQALMLAFRGVPAVYFHSLVGTGNYHEGVERTGMNRTINRRKYDRDELREQLQGDTRQNRIFREYLQMLRRRTNHPAFHPDAPMRVHDLGGALLGFSRHARDGSETIFCVFNFTPRGQTLRIPTHVLNGSAARAWYDILSARTLSSGKRGITLAPYQALWIAPRG